MSDALGQASLLDVQDNGGVIASAEESSGVGTDTGDGVWSTGDVAYADQIVACAIRDLHADPRRIHVAGYGLGGLQTVYMWYARSGYVASALTYSGGSAVVNVTSLQDPTHVPPAIAAHGASGSDVNVLDFAQASATWEADIDAKMGFVIDCNDGGNYLETSRMTTLAPSAWAFFAAHLFAVTPEPYASGLPATFPGTCKIH